RDVSGMRDREALLDLRRQPQTDELAMRGPFMRHGAGALKGIDHRTGLSKRIEARRQARLADFAAGSFQALRGIFDRVFGLRAGAVPKSGSAQGNPARLALAAYAFAPSEHARNEIDILDGARKEADGIAAFGGQLHAAAVDQIVGRLVTD